MKKKILATLLLSVAASQSYAQEFFGDSAQRIQSEIEWLFPILAGIIFLVGVALNLGKFFGENRDIKQGITNILIFVAVIIGIGGVYAVIKNFVL